MAILAAILLLPSDTADARRRRAKAKGRILGQIDASAILLHARKGQAWRDAKAYWLFGVPNLQERRPRPDHRRLVVFLDVWDENRAGRIRVPYMRISGGAFVPEVLVVPRRSDTETVTLQNQDLMTHHLRSPDHTEFNHVVLQQSGEAPVKINDILPMSTGRFSTYRVRSRDLSRLRGEVLVLKSTAYTRPTRSGRFSLARLPKGEHTLRIYFRGKVVGSRKVTIGRRPLKLKPWKLTREP